MRIITPSKISDLTLAEELFLRGCPMALAKSDSLRDTVVFTGVPQQAEPEFDPWEEPEFIEVLAPSRGLLWGVCAGLVIYAVVAVSVWIWSVN